MTTERIPSMLPEHMTEGGLFAGPGVVKAIKWALWDYGGTVSNAVPALIMTIQPPDGDAIEQVWSAGDASKFVPSNDGTHLTAVGTADELSKSCNVYHLNTELLNNGFPRDKAAAYQADCRVLVGMDADWSRKEIKRDGLPPRAPSPTGQPERKPSVLVPGPIRAIPGLGIGAVANTVVGGAPAAPVANGNTEALALVVAAAEAALGTKNPTHRKDVAKVIYSVHGDDPNHDAALDLLYEDTGVQALSSSGISLNGEELSK